MPDTDLKKLSDKDYDKAKKDFLRKTSQAARDERVKRLEEHRANAPTPAELGRMGPSEFEKSKQKFFRSLR